eukprot:7144564-Prymnesium_polylepis.2
MDGHGMCNMLGMAIDERWVERQCDMRLCVTVWSTVCRQRPPARPQPRQQSLRNHPDPPAAASPTGKDPAARVVGRASDPVCTAFPSNLSPSMPVSSSRSQEEESQYPAADFPRSAFAKLSRLGSRRPKRAQNQCRPGTTPSRALAGRHRHHPLHWPHRIRLVQQQPPRRTRPPLPH